MQQKTQVQEHISEPPVQVPAVRVLIEIPHTSNEVSQESGDDVEIQMNVQGPNIFVSKQDAGKNGGGGKELSNKKKVKKPSPKCSVCKKVGLKLQSRQCTQCKHWYHLNCAKQTAHKEKASRKFLCNDCEFPDHTQSTGKQGEKRAALEAKKIEKQKAKDVQLTLNFKPKILHEQTFDTVRLTNSQTLKTFEKLYPHHMDGDRIKFPIDDKLLLIYRQLFDPQRQLPKPQQSTGIPSNYLGDILVIENFCMSFRNVLQLQFEPTKDTIFKSFVTIKQTQTKHPSDLCFKQLLGQLLLIYLGDVFDKNKTQNVKSLNENPFFEILNFLKENEQIDNFLPKIWREVIDRLQKVPSLDKAFDGLGQELDIESLSGKMFLIKELIMGLSQVDTFHDMMYRKTDKKQDMTKQRTQLVLNLKRDQAQILTQAQIIKQNEAKCKQLQQQMKSCQNNIEVSRVVRQLDRIRKSISKTQTQMNVHIQNVSNIKARIGEINKSLPFITSEIQFLGRDRNQSQYYLYSRQPNTLYVNFKTRLLSEQSSFKIIKGKETIVSFIKNLNHKGMKQKFLHGVIQSHIKNGVIKDIDSMEQTDHVVEPLSYQASRIVLSTQDITNVLLECDNRFTDYLTPRNCRWANPGVRLSFKSTVQRSGSSGDVKSLKESLKYLHQQFLSVENLGGEDQESDQAKSEKMEGKEDQPCKKKRIRLWGIYFEKIKKYWLEYLDTTDNVMGVWLSSIVLKHFVQRYIKKKIENLEQRQRRLQKQVEKQKQRDRHRHKQNLRLEQSQEQHEEQQQQLSQQKPKPTRRGRLVRKSQRNVRHINLKQVSSSQDKYSLASQSEQGSHEDACEVCGQFGQMLCCDTCPKVFHIDCLKLKQIPEGQWNCLKCHQKFVSERQTRSRSKKLYIQ